MSTINKKSNTSDKCAKRLETVIVSAPKDGSGKSDDNNLTLKALLQSKSNNGSRPSGENKKKGERFSRERTVKKAHVPEETVTHVLTYGKFSSFFFSKSPFSR